MKNIETKIAKNGAIVYYVDSKRVSREIALDAANENRKGNLFTFETGYWNENTKTVNYKTLMIIAECTIKIQQKAFLHDLGFRIIVSGVEVKTFYASKDIAYDIKKARQNAAVLANKIAHAYICGAFGIRIMGRCDIKILNAPITEPDIDDYAVSTDAQDVATNAEIENANRNTVNVETGNSENLTANQILAAQIVAKLGNLIVKCESGEFGTRRGQIFSYDTFVDKKDEFGTALHFCEVFTDEENFILDHVNLINGYDDDKTIEKFYFTKPTNDPNIDDYAVTTDAQDIATNAEIELATNATVTSNKLKIQQDAISKDVQAAPVDIPNTFEVGKIYHLRSYLRKCNLKVIKRGSTYLTFSVLNNHGQETDLTERYKIHSNRESEFVNVNTISRFSTELYATNLVADFEKNSVKTPAVTNGADVTTNVESTSEENAPVEDFAAQFAALIVARDAAEADFEQKISARKAAEKAEDLAADTFHDAQRAYEKFGNDKAKELRNKLITSDIRATNKLLIYDQSGSVYCPALKYLDICFINDKFEIRCDKEASCIVYKFAEYDSPEQVNAVISLLKDAIAIGKQDFQFPTVDDLNQPLTLPPNIKDSIQRAMQTALDKYKDFCRTGQLVRAEHELKLYNICRRAKIQLACGNDEPPPEVKLPAPFKPTDADSAPSKILPTEFCLKYLNDAAPDGWTVTADGKAFLVKFKGNVIATLDSLATAKALPPDKFFAQFTPLVDKNFEPKEIFLKDLYRERNELLAMRDELPDDSDRLPAIDAMIKQLDRDIAKAEFAEYERTGIPIWF